MKKNSKSGITSFKRWTRKSYGAFSSLGRVMRIGVLSVSMSIITLNSKSVAARPDTLRIANEEAIEALTVTAEKLKNPTRGATAPTEVYRRDDSFAAPTQTIESVLRLNPVIDVRERGGKGVQADLSIRGGNADQTMILLNGIDFTDARTGHQSHSLPVDPETVSSIDIIGGLTGIGAYSGAINITTAPLRPNYVRAEIAGGAYGYLYSNLSGAVSRNGLTVLAAGSIRRSDGYMANTDFFNSNLFTRITYHDASVGMFDFQAGYQWRDFGSNGFYSLKFPDQFEHTETALTSLRWSRLVGRVTLNADVNYRRNQDRYELYRAGRGAPDGWHPNHHATDNVGASVSGDLHWAAGVTSLGVDWRYNALLSNVLGEDLGSPVAVPGAIETFYTKGKQRNTVNGWLRHRADIGSTSLAGSFNIAGSPYGTFPSWCLSVEQAILEGWSASLSADRSMRLPTFTDLYYTTATHIGNPNLKPERALNFVLDTRYSHRGLSVGGSLFYRRGTDIIDWELVSTDTGDKWKSTQLTTLDTFGADATLSYRTGGWLRHATVSYGWLTADKNTTGGVTKYALDYMRHKLTFQVGVRVWRGLSAEITAGWYDRNATATETAVDPFWLMDARLSWDTGIFTVYVDATNLFNSTYYDFVGLRQPPRWLTAGVVITI